MTTGRDRLANMTDAVHMNAPVATADPVVAIPFIGIGHFDEVIGWFAKWPPSKPICLSILA